MCGLASHLPGILAEKIDGCLGEHERQQLAAQAFMSINRDALLVLLQALEQELALELPGLVF